MRLYGIFGAGGFGREVISVARDMLRSSPVTEEYELVFIVENLKNEALVNGYKVISKEMFIAYDATVKKYNIAIADYIARERIANEMLDRGIASFDIISNTCVDYDMNQIGEGVVLCPFSIITANVRIGRFFHCNIYSYVAHDCIVGDFVTFAPNVHCNGRVVVEDYAYIGTGAVIREGTEDRGITIGKGSIVGMGSVVTKSVPPFTTVVGNPAVQLRRNK